MLEIQRFGRSTQSCVWIEASKALEVARFLASDEECRLDWLENFSVMQIEAAFVATYFVRSTATKATFIFRSSVQTVGEHEELELPSVSQAWPMALPFEMEAGELFGIRFVDDAGVDLPRGGGLLPKHWDGFPLRKEYKLPRSHG